MFGLSFGHIAVLAAIGLIVLGPEQMPQLARVLGRTLAELKKAMHDVTMGLTDDIKETEKPKEEVKKEEPKSDKAPLV
jgi:sec-independent protein translocase protein TatB